ACQETCPSYYKVSEADNKTTIKDGKRISDASEVLEASGELGCIREGAEACPYNAIHIIDLDRNIKLI
ncbi:MAG: ferredoxin, partial [Candidatus Bathyarchaeia archaeon]